LADDQAKADGPGPWSSANAYGMHWTGGAMYNVTGQIGKGAFATVYKIDMSEIPHDFHLIVDLLIKDTVFHEAALVEFFCSIDGHGAIYAAKELDKRRFMKNGILDQKVDNEMKIMRDTP
jgi:hypothetical protein